MSYYSPEKIASDQKDIRIAQLKAENFELKQKERDYNSLHSQLLDLEHRFQMLQEEKIRMEKDFSLREDLHYRTIDNLKLDVNRLNEQVLDRTSSTREIVSELTAYKTIIDDKNIEIAKLKAQLGEYLDQNSRLISEKRTLENENDLLRSSKRVAMEEADKLRDYSTRLSKSGATDSERLKDLEYLLARKNRQLEEANDEIALLRAEKKRQMAQVDVLLEGKKLTESQLRSVERKLAESSLLLDSREKELRTTKNILNMEESKQLDVKVELRKLLREKETLEYLKDDYRKEADVQRRLRESELRKSGELLEMKKKLERDCLNKEIEAYSAKKELERVKPMSDNLIMENYDLKKEMDALEDHANVLENQNIVLNKEIDKIVDEDEMIKRDLDRKSRINYLKQKNEEELQRSAEKVRKSRSPERRSPYRSNYESPYRKSPSKY